MTDELLSCPFCPAHTLELDPEHEDYACPECGLCGPMWLLAKIAGERAELARLRPAHGKGAGEALVALNSRIKALAEDLREHARGAELASLTADRALDITVEAWNRGKSVALSAAATRVELLKGESA